MNDTIHQEITLARPPAEVYAILTDSARFSAMSGGAPADISRDAGGTFSCFGGMIHGRHVELVPGERLVQAWRVKLWDPGVYSLVRFTLQPEGKGTKVILDHSSYPDGQGAHLAAGWHKNYWEPLAK